MSADSENTVNGYLAADHDRLDGLLGEASEQVLSVGSSSTVPGVTAAGIRPRAVAVNEPL